MRTDSHGSSLDADSQPQNILVDEACSRVVLVDFGIASELLQEATQASIPEALEGTDQRKTFSRRQALS